MTRDYYLHPLTTQPAVEEFQASFWLVQWYHMASRMESHEGEIAIALDLTDLLTTTTTTKLQVLEPSLIIGFLTRPLKRFGPCMVTEPVADEVCVTLFIGN